MRTARTSARAGGGRRRALEKQRGGEKERWQVDVESWKELEEAMALSGSGEETTASAGRGRRSGLTQGTDQIEAAVSPSSPLPAGSIHFRVRSQPRALFLGRQAPQSWLLGCSLRSCESPARPRVGRAIAPSISVLPAAQSRRLRRIYSLETERRRTGMRSNRQGRKEGRKEIEVVGRIGKVMGEEIATQQTTETGRRERRRKDEGR